MVNLEDSTDDQMTIEITLISLNTQTRAPCCPLTVGHDVVNLSSNLLIGQGRQVGEGLEHPPGDVNYY